MQAESHNQKLTSGRLSDSIFRLAGPMFVSALLQNVQSLIDLFWVGRLGSHSVAALAMAGTILMLLFPVIMGISAGTVAFVSRHVGANQNEEASSGAEQSLIMALFLGLTAGIAGWMASPWFLDILGAAPEVAAPGTAYLRISFLGSFTIFLLFIGNSILQAAGNSVIPMAIMVLANILNLILDPIFIFGLLGMPRLEVQGAALATVLSQALACIIILKVLCKGVHGIRIMPSHLQIRPSLMWRIMRVGLPGSGQMLSRSLMSLVLMRIVAACGTAAVAAYGIGMRFHMIILMPAFSLGNAAATLVGQNLGAGKPERAHRAAWAATGMDIVIMIAAAVITQRWAPELMRFFDSTPEVVDTGASFLRITLPFYLFTALAIVLGRALQGAGDTLGPMILTIISLWGLQVPLAILLSRRLDPPTLGIWWAIAIAVTVHGLLITAWFQTGRWKNRVV